MNDSRVEVETGQKDLELSHQQLELADKNSEYGQRKADYLKMKNDYSLIIDSAKRGAKRQDLIAVLGQMVTNRQRAVELGDKTAATDIKWCQDEEKRWK